ncbi:hypothetical protein HYX19_01350 [Candidatus Woesearchaeota archaeon]|nr:hypothetical protein [Candidatus Woesearchaeota archaeon]
MELEEAVKQIIRDTRRNKLVWKTNLEIDGADFDSNYLETAAKIGYPDMSSEITTVRLFRNTANTLDGVYTYNMMIGNILLREKQYAPLRKFGEYMFLDDLK